MPNNNKQLTVPLDTNFEQMIISATRYACGRMTYIVSDTVQYVSKLLPLLSEWCIGVILTDLEANLEMESRCPERSNYIWGMEMDRKLWMQMLDHCREEKRKRENCQLPHN